ncbi:hypothetical protein BDD12DRAFT_808043 [Trichophaea hybrida]|nr:hypothetical protein BDD12DRAFT_808043 [Trichophaea hybrida]
MSSAKNTTPARATAADVETVADTEKTFPENGIRNLREFLHNHNQNGPRTRRNRFHGKPAPIPGIPQNASVTGQIDESCTSGGHSEAASDSDPERDEAATRYNNDSTSAESSTRRNSLVELASKAFQEQQPETDKFMGENRTDIGDADAGAKSCNPGQRRKTAGGAFLNVSTMDSGGSSSQTPNGDDDKEDAGGSHCWRNGNGKRPAEDQDPQQLADSSEKQYACPYYKNDNAAHQECSHWGNTQLPRIINTYGLANVHGVVIEPESSISSSLTRKGQTVLIPRETFPRVEASGVRKGKNLGRKSWKQMYILLFGCRIKDVPIPCKAIQLGNSVVLPQDLTNDTDVEVRGTISSESDSDEDSTAAPSNEQESNTPDSSSNQCTDARELASFLSPRIAVTIEHQSSKSDNRTLDVSQSTTIPAELRPFPSRLFAVSAQDIEWQPSLDGTQTVHAEHRGMNVSCESVNTFPSLTGDIDQQLKLTSRSMGGTAASADALFLPENSRNQDDFDFPRQDDDVSRLLPSVPVADGQSTAGNNYLLEAQFPATFDPNSHTQYAVDNVDPYELDGDGNFVWEEPDPIDAVQSSAALHGFTGIIYDPAWYGDDRDNTVNQNQLENPPVLGLDVDGENNNAGQGQHFNRNRNHTPEHLRFVLDLAHRLDNCPPDLSNMLLQQMR